MSQPTAGLREGDEIEGFVVHKITPLEGLRSVAYEMEHRETGARTLHLANDDAENLLAIAFPTLPPDDTGLPHILEHVALDGSRKYPVQKPFMEMVKMSMATFINAMTYKDKTVYPIASNVRQDFYNLAEVYCDAVFHPRLSENSFRQEGHRLDFAAKNDITSDLIIKGIVYNEMKGALSSPDSLIGTRSTQWLFPDTPYGRQSGGDPDVMPTLTYEGFRRFYEQFYHPGNAFILFYGDIPTRDHLAFLSPRLAGFTKTPIHAALPTQPRWSEPRRREDHYPIGSGEEMTGKTYLNMAWIVGDATDAPDVMAFNVLDLILSGNQAAPLRKALIDSRLGADLSHSGFSAGLRDSTFRVGIKGSEPDRENAFCDLVISTLDKIAAEGIESDRVEAAFQQLAYQYLEIQSGFPLVQMNRVYSAWIHGADPLTFLRGAELLRDLRGRYEREPDLFSRMIRERLLENSHRLTSVFLPDRELTSRKDARFAELMLEKKSAMTREELERIARDAEELDEAQSKANTPEDLATLPQLRVSDVPRQPREIPTQIERLQAGITLLRNDVFSNGVNYFHLDIDLEGMPEDLQAFLPLYGSCVSKMGAAGQSYEKMAERVSAYTGGVHFWSYCRTHAVDPDHFLRRAGFSLKALDARIDEALSVLHDYFFALDPTEPERLKVLLAQARAAHRSRVISNGLGLALSHAARVFNPVTGAAETMHGLPQIQLVEDLDEHYEERRDWLIERLIALRGFLLDRSRLTGSFTGSDAAYASVRRRLEDWGAEIAASPGRVSAPPGPGTDSANAGKAEGLAAPMDVAFCARVMPAPHSSHPDAPLLAVGSRLLSMDYMLEEVRVKGGAYGGGCGHSGGDRTWNFYSFRDPWVKRTLDTFDGAADFARKADWTQIDVDRAIIGTAKGAERPIRPADATGTALARYVSGDTPELRKQRHVALLEATPPSIKRALADLFETGSPHARTCVVSSRAKLEQANVENLAPSLVIEDVL
ncbi:MAG TPA: insulinase family protein [Armatimonadota bacterium]|nr:insulinase family protein [Armatimonadota bacterium]